jgi:hypothetical protein
MSSWLWDDFKPHEVLSPDGLVCYEEGQLFFSPAFIMNLQRFRHDLQRPILINHAGLKLRGYRSPRENVLAGGQSQSLHVMGLAADCTVPEMTSGELAEKAEKSGIFTGIGIYKNFVHLDCRWVLDNRIRKWEG